MFRYILILVCLSHSCSARFITDEDVGLLANESSLDVSGYVSAVLKQSLPVLHNIRNKTDLDFTTLLPVHIEVENVSYSLNATLHFLGVSGEPEEAYSTFSIDSTSLNVSSAIILPHLMYDIIFELRGNDNIIIETGVGESMNLNLTANWNFTVNDNDLYEIDIKGTSGTGLQGDAIAAINGENLSEELQSQIVKQLRSDIGISSDLIFSPFSDILFDATDEVNVNDFLVVTDN